MKPFRPRNAPMWPMTGAYSLVELLATIAILSLLSVAALKFTGVRSAVAETKLQTDVVRLNSLIAQFAADGGSLEDLQTPSAVLARLKTVRASAEGHRQVGALTGRYVDVRLVAQYQSSTEAADESPRAVWNNTRKRFEVTSSPGAPGIKDFVLDDVLAEKDHGTDTTRNRTAMLYNRANGWVWEPGEHGEAQSVTPMSLELVHSDNLFDPASPMLTSAAPPSAAPPDPEPTPPLEAPSTPTPTPETPTPTPSTPLGTLGSPVLTTTGYDEVTGPNTFQKDGKRHWYVTPGADQYANDKWERPTAQSYGQYDQGYATLDGEYFGNLDIVNGSVGFDAAFVYFSINLWSPYKHSSDGSDTYEGLIYDYSIRFGMNGNGTGSFLLTAEQPASKVGTSWGTSGLFGYHDANGDLGTNGDGYETQVISDGKASSGTQNALYARVNPADSTEVQFALLFTALGFTREDIPNVGYIVYQTAKGLKSPSNMLWNKEYSSSEAGSPNAGTGGLSEFGTQGLGNVYEADTYRGVAPTP